MSENNGKNVGRIEEITGVVVDVLFPENLPEIFSAIVIEVDEGNGRDAMSVVCEVQQHLGDDRVRTVAMDATDGLERHQHTDQSCRNAGDVDCQRIVNENTQNRIRMDPERYAPEELDPWLPWNLLAAQRAAWHYPERPP